MLCGHLPAEASREVFTRLMRKVEIVCWSSGVLLCDPANELMSIRREIGNLDLLKRIAFILGKLKHEIVGSPAIGNQDDLKMEMMGRIMSMSKNKEVLF